ncbi:TIGR02281 family clan AA aspartic protease, partial [uncultured Sphingomonas sp.]
MNALSAAGLSGHEASLVVTLATLLLVVVIASRLPIIGRLVRIATWIGLLALLVMVVQDRGRFDPYLSHVVRLLRLDDQSVVGDEVRIAMSPDGHFWARARIDGVQRRRLVDSGATVTALSTGTAAAAGLDVGDPMFPMALRTANGTIAAQTATIGTLRLGDVIARDLPVVVSPAFGDTDVLGMNFLSQLKSWRVEGNILILVPHHPQKKGDYVVCKHAELSAAYS